MGSLERLPLDMLTLILSCSDVKDVNGIACASKTSNSLIEDLNNFNDYWCTKLKNEFNISHTKRANVLYFLLKSSTNEEEYIRTVFNSGTLPYYFDVLITTKERLEVLENLVFRESNLNLFKRMIETFHNKDFFDLEKLVKKVFENVSRSFIIYLFESSYEFDRAEILGFHQDFDYPCFLGNFSILVRCIREMFPDSISRLESILYRDEELSSNLGRYQVWRYFLLDKWKAGENFVKQLLENGTISDQEILRYMNFLRKDSFRFGGKFVKILMTTERSIKNSVAIDFTKFGYGSSSNKKIYSMITSLKDVDFELILQLFKDSRGSGDLLRHIIPFEDFTLPLNFITLILQNKIFLSVSVVELLIKHRKIPYKDAAGYLLIHKDTASFAEPVVMSNYSDFQKTYILSSMLRAGVLKSDKSLMNSVLAFKMVDAGGYTNAVMAIYNKPFSAVSESSFKDAIKYQLFDLFLFDKLADVISNNSITRKTIVLIVDSRKVTKCNKVTRDRLVKALNSGSYKNVDAAIDAIRANTK